MEFHPRGVWPSSGWRSVGLQLSQSGNVCCETTKPHMFFLCQNFGFFPEKKIHVPKVSSTQKRKSARYIKKLKSTKTTTGWTSTFNNLKLVTPIAKNRISTHYKENEEEQRTAKSAKRKGKIDAGRRRGFKVKEEQRVEIYRECQ